MYNSVWHITRGLLKTRPWHTFMVAELPGAGAQRFPLDELLPIIRPTISVVTSIGDDHKSVFRTLDAVAEHKGKVVDYLPAHGVAVLNADDPRVIAMRDRCAGRVITCGLSPDADVRASDVSSAWPERLSFLAHSHGKSVRVQTQLCGTHWVPYVLAALAIGEVMDIPLEDGAGAIAAMSPFPGRLSPATPADGITFIRDDEKAPLWTVDAALNVMRAASASRKIAVIGTLSDFRGNDRPKVVAVAHRVFDAVDAVVAVGAHGPYYLRAGRDRGKPASAFATAEQARVFLREFLKPGDLVLSKGSDRTDGLEHIVRNWNLELPMPEPFPAGEAREQGRPRVIVGLGNPAPQYAKSPHNIGYRTLDLIAARMRASWATEADAMVATVAVGGLDVCLVKFRTPMNETGPRLRALADRLGVSASGCVVVHDDLDLAPGSVRWRTNGSAGGHRGLGSILVAFQSDGVHRIKVGVGRPTEGNASTFVLAPLGRELNEIVAASLECAADLALEAATTGPDAKGRTIQLGATTLGTSAERLALETQS